ncbi:MAG: hypothetical protein ND895_28890 [Pyrinomonadaceae bacterium]|nr:hypothetical protein [Pyrinomonadaceae bacterium]
MKANIKTFLLALAMLPLPWLSFVANACTCAEISPCEAYASAAVVFMGQAKRTSVASTTSHLPSNAMSTTLTSGSPVTLFKVERAFRGVSAETIEISGGGTTCDYYFRQGERYLVYAYQDSDAKTFHTTICSGTAPLSEAKADLTYLIRVMKSPSGGTVSGEISREVNNVDKDEPTFEPIPKGEVILENGHQRFQAVSDARGKFELRGLPQGRYRVHTNPPTNYSRSDVMAEEPRNEWELDVPGQGCLQTWFLARPEGEISGTIVDPSGIVPEDVEPELIPVDKELKDDNFRSVRLGDFRRFKFSFLPPGRYYLGFNMGSGPSIMEPYPEFYYPGLEQRSKATVITLSEGQKVSNIYLPRPVRLAERMIEGYASWPDGRPFISKCGIQLQNPKTGYREGNCVDSDARGYFIIKAIEGQTYELSASTTSGKSVALVNSKPIVVKVGKENIPVKLVVTLP